MHQTLRIFRKDCRHFWPEITTVLALTAVYVWIYPAQWIPGSAALLPTNRGALDVHHRQLLANLVTGLIPLTWFILVARVTHDENLIGIRQFWLTRPYRWSSLLVEKLLFLFLFTFVSFFLAETALLMRAGFSPVHFVPNLLYGVFCITSLTVVPFFALATVCPSLLRMFIPLIAIVAIVVAAAFFSSSSPSDPTPSVSVPYSDNLSIPLILLLCGIVLVLQYRKRRLWLSRAVLALIPVFITVLVAFPAEKFLFNYYYPALGPGASPVTLSFQQRDAPDIRVTNYGGTPEIHFPAHVSGIAPSSNLLPDDLRVTLTAADGTHTTHDWQPNAVQYFDKDADYYTLVANTDQSFLTKHKGELFTVTYDVAFTQLEEQAPLFSAYAPGDDWMIPGIGFCQLQADKSMGLHCRVPFHDPGRANLSVLATPAPCTLGDDGRTETQFQVAWIGSLHSDPSDIGLTPVWARDYSLNPSQIGPVSTKPIPFTICPGAPVTVTPYRLVRRCVYKFTVEDVNLFPPAEELPTPKGTQPNQNKPQPLPQMHPGPRRTA
jgi:hypothetical protein